MHDQYVADMFNRNKKVKEEKKARHEEENKRIAREEAKFITNDMKKIQERDRFVQELNDATEYQQFLKDADKQAQEVDHRQYMKYC